MEQSFRNLLILILGITLLVLSIVMDAILVDTLVVANALLVTGLLVTILGAYLLRAELNLFFKKQQGEALAWSVGMVGIVVAVCYLSIKYPFRIDMTQGDLYSLSAETIDMLENLKTPVHISFFHDPMMRDTVEFYQLIASKSDKVTVEFHDPMLNPSIARMKGVEFSGTALFESEGRRLQVNTAHESDIANGILKISQGIQQTICFLDGHGEPDPFSLEQHDHNEGDIGHEHGLGTQYVLHERHGMAKLRNSLESMNYVVSKVTLAQGGGAKEDCAVFLVAGPQTPLMLSEVQWIDQYIKNGNNILFMLDPFVKTGLEPIIEKLGVVLDNNLVLDPESHFWADISSPAVTNYNRHSITDDLTLTFFPGVRSLSPTDVPVSNTNVRPLINTSLKSYGETEIAQPGFNDGVDRKGPLTLMVIVERNPGFGKNAEAMARELRGETVEKTAAQEVTGPSSRIAIIGDSDFATNSFFHVMGNGKLLLSTINYLAAQEDLIGLEPKSLDIARVNLTNTQMKGTFVLSIILIPALMAIIGIAVWWRRR
ncbi:MAG: GldG family protein [Proteobacteria bacterium]|nr:GldG family protein [Pseudomonadota bacterium]MDA1331221.1 GldG family protein [Pseudomonadota bacterium]